MKVVDNFELIDNLLKNSFEFDGDTFFHLQVIRRGKDHKDMASANRTIKSYYIDKVEKLSNIKEEVKTLCELFGARAYINLNPKSYQKCTMQCIADMAKRACDGDFKKIYKQWNSVVGLIKPIKKNDVRWIVDVDFPFVEKTYKPIEDELVKIWVQMNIIKKKETDLTEDDVKSHIADYIYAIIPTKSGYHIITRPFDLQKFNDAFENTIDVHKNNPTILYIPEINK